MITKFTGEHAFLSNFWHSPMVLGNRVVDTVEHGFQSWKTLDPEWRRRILDADTPGQAKRLGRKAPLREDWQDVKVDVMRSWLERKFSDPDLRLLLDATKPHTLVEGNTWNDTIWGACPRSPLTQESLEKFPQNQFWGTWEIDGWVCDLIGENWLGRLLMEIRDGERG